jgi:hypothetical protein
MGKLISRVRHCRWDRTHLIGNAVGEPEKFKIVEFKFSVFTCKSFPNVVFGCALEAVCVGSTRFYGIKSGQDINI